MGMDETRIPALAVVGWHNSGKTRLVVELTKILSEYGLRVATVKHAADLQELEDPMSDSAKHQAAGARETLLVGRNRCALYRRLSPGDEHNVPLELLSDGTSDLILVEGFKHSHLPKIETYRRTERLVAAPLAGEVDVRAVVTNEQIALPDGVRVFRWSEMEALAEWVMECIIGERGTGVEHADGRKSGREGRET